jgi:hypothetical protein
VLEEAAGGGRQVAEAIHEFIRRRRLVEVDKASAAQRQLKLRFLVVGQAFRAMRQIRVQQAGKGRAKCGETSEEPSELRQEVIRKVDQVRLRGVDQPRSGRSSQCLASGVQVRCLAVHRNGAAFM